MSDTNTTKVDLLYPYVDKSGTEHDAGKPATLPAQEAADLVHLGRAVEPKQKAADKPATNGGK